MSQQSRPDRKAQILAIVVFLLFLLDLAEFVIWKVGRFVEPFLHKPPSP